MFECKILSFFRRFSCLVRAFFSLARVDVISFNISSLTSQIEPFSPILKQTSLGSIHTVNSSGKALNSVLDTPVKCAASRMMGSIADWFIRIHRNPLPNNGFCGCQCVLYRSHRSSSIFDVNICNLGSLMWLLLLSIKNRNLQAVLTSFFMIFMTLLRNVRCRFQFPFWAGRVVVHRGSNISVKVLFFSLTMSTTFWFDSIVFFSFTMRSFFVAQQRNFRRTVTLVTLILNVFRRFTSVWKLFACVW